MPGRITCPHCKGSYRFPPDYHGQTVRCYMCEKPFRIRVLQPLNAELNAWPEPPPEAVAIAHDPDFPLIPYEEIPPAPPAQEPTLYDDLLPEDPPPILLEELKPAEIAATAPPMEAQTPQSQSLLDLLDLSLPVESYLPSVQPDSKSLLDSLDLTLRTDPVENAPILLEEIKPVEASAEWEPLLLVEHKDEPDASEPILAEPVEEAPGFESPADQKANVMLGVPRRSIGAGPEGSRRSRERSAMPRRRPIPARERPSNWLIENRGPIVLIAVMIFFIVLCIVIFKAMEDRPPSRSSFARDTRPQLRFERPERDWENRFGPPPMVEQPLPEQLGDPPGNDVKKPFDQPPMIEPKIVPMPEPKKVRPKSKLPQEKREWVDLSPNSITVEKSIGQPRIDSTPVEQAAKGTTYNYLLEVRVQMNGAKALLEYAPPGMKLQNDARLIWEVPADFPEKEADVTIRVRQPDGKECTQTFVISIR